MIKIEGTQGDTLNVGFFLDEDIHISEAKGKSYTFDTGIYLDNVITHSMSRADEDFLKYSRVTVGGLGLFAGRLRYIRITPLFIPSDNTLKEDFYTHSLHRLAIKVEYPIHDEITGSNIIHINPIYTRTDCQIRKGSRIMDANIRLSRIFTICKAMREEQ